MKDKKTYTQKSIENQPLSLQKILFYLALFFQISHLVTQSNAKGESIFIPSQSRLPQNDFSLLSDMTILKQEAFLPLFLYALMPREIKFSPITVSMLLGMANLSVAQASWLSQLCTYKTQVNDKQENHDQLEVLALKPNFSEVGLISYYVTGELPDGYIKCDGNEYLVSEKEELYQEIGREYGYRIDAVTKQEYFNVPNLQNSYLRIRENWMKGEYTHTLKEYAEDKHSVYTGVENNEHDTTSNDAKNQPKSVTVKYMIKYRATDLESRIAQLESEINALENQRRMTFFAGTATAAAGVAVVSAAALFLKK